ncbi:MAG: hypothetical protein LBG96_09945 [Tannerella sp.]|jgi:hypothetical protein|nr:hypothetical protein [Tannerella sp.]
MPQAILPLFTEDMTIVSMHVGVAKREGSVYYFQDCFPFYHHREDADIIVDNEKQVLHVKIHRTDHWADDKILVNLCEQLNQTQTIFPGYNLTLFYDLVTD